MDLLDLFAKIGMDTSEYEAGVEKASGLAGKMGGAIKTGMKVGAAAITAVTGATVALTKGLFDGAKQVSDYGDNIDKASQKLGFTAEAFQEWDQILQYNGASIDALAAPMRTLNNLAEQGSEAFTALGLSQEDVASMNSQELFEATIAGLQGIADEGERSRLATDLLGKGARELAPLLNTTAEETEALRQHVHDLGGVMSDESVKAAAVFNDSLTDLQTAFGGLKRGLTEDFMPGITMVMDGLTQIFSGDPDSGIAMISEGVDNVLTELNEKLPIFLDTGVAILGALLQAFIENLPKLLEMGGKLVGQLIAGLIGAIPDLIRSIPQLIEAIITGLVAAWPEIRDAGIDLVTMIGDGILSAIDAAKTWGSDLIQNFIDGIKSKFSALGDAVSSVAQKVKDFIGFSEPDEGPLSNFHTYAPDMMELFAKGIRDNEDLIADSFNNALDFGINTPAAEGGGTFAGAAASEPIHVTFELLNEIDGAIFSRKTYDYFVDEKTRRGPTAQLAF